LTLPDNPDHSHRPDLAQNATTWFQSLIPDISFRALAFQTSGDVVDEEILALFEKQMRLTINSLVTAIAAGDFAEVRRHAHSLQGMGGTAGSPEISVVGEELSRYAKQGDLTHCSELTTRLNDWQTCRTPALNARSTTSPQSSSRLAGRILVVDDELANRVFLRKLLSDNGAEVTEAVNGEQALELARQTSPDLALVDVVMPGLSGYELCRRLTSDPATRHITVIIVTAQSAAEDVEHAFALGAFDYIRKPFLARELMARVENALQLKRQGDELRRWQSRMVQELDAAGALQRKLLTTGPFFSRSIEVYTAYQSSMSVGGDVFDTITLPNKRTCIYIGDVAGHGVGPAMISTLLKTLIYELVHDHAEHGPATICNALHRRFRYYVTNPEVYATLFMAMIDADGKQCVAFNCGHPMPLVFDALGTQLPGFADRGGLPLGLHAGNGDDPYSAGSEVQTSLPPGAAMFLFTDGLLEARNAKTGEPPGSEHVTGLMGAVAGDMDIFEPAREVLRWLTDQTYDLTQDDCTLLVVRSLNAAAIRLDRNILPVYGQVAELAVEVEQFLHNEGWRDDAATAVRLLVMEHGVNVVDHALLPHGSHIRLQIRLTAHTASLLFRDDGQEWDFTERLAFSMRRPDDCASGRGLRIIKSIAKHIDVVRRDCKNTVRYVVSRDFTIDSNTRTKESV